MAILFRPKGDITKAPIPRNASDRNLYDFLTDRLGTSVCHDPAGKFVDYEDWMEPARMLEAALVLGYEVHVLPELKLKKAMDAPLFVLNGKPSPKMLIGRRLKSDDQESSDVGLSWPSKTAYHAAHYAEMDVFRKHAGRDFLLCDMPGEPAPRTSFSAAHSPPSGDATVAMASFAGSDIIVKQVIPIKSMCNATMSIPEGATPEGCYGILLEELEYHMARMEGERDALLVQKVVEMQYETRFFIVGHKVVCAAACIESDTPRLDIHGPMLLDSFEKTRNDGHIVKNPMIIDSLILKAEDIARDVELERPEMRSYVIDLAIGADGSPLIIEFNPIDNSGMYAIKSIDLMSAYIEEAVFAEKHPDVYSEDIASEEGILSM